MAKEIERAGIPVAHVCSIITISQTVGANRIVPSVAIPHPLGNPKVSPEEEKELRRNLLKKALDALQTPIEEQTVFSYHILDIGEGDFDKEVMESEFPVLVDFFTPPCAPCKALIPVLERAAGKFPNVDNQGLCARFKIVGVPALLFFKGGQNVLRLDGFDASTETRIEDALKELVAM
jgi:glycine reductase